MTKLRRLTLDLLATGVSRSEAAKLLRTTIGSVCQMENWDAHLAEKRDRYRRANPPKYECGKCSGLGHNARTCTKEQDS